MSRQMSLFTGLNRSPAAGAEHPLTPRQLREWLARIAAHQHPLLAGRACGALQMSLLPGREPSAGLAAPPAEAQGFDPCRLTAQSLNFWRWPDPPQAGAAIYVVMDRPDGLDAPLLLYVGETGRADRRWKGEHDCKSYLAAYAEALSRADLASAPSIRFWTDVPQATKPRRQLEQALIQRWLPPFNKETRQRWATPFTADTD
jgi:hypothetical protein